MKTAVKVFLTLMITHAAPVSAETPQKKGYRIAKAAKRFHQGYKDYTVTGKMILKDASNRSTARHMTLKFLEGKKDNDRTLIVFSKPADIKGSALLTKVNPGKDDDQFLYLPALKRVKRIVSSNRKSAFMGSEFSFEDMAPKLIDDFKYKFLKEAPCGNKQTCWVIDSFPIARKTAYSKQQFWIEKKNYLALKIKYFDRKKKHFKTLSNLKPKKFNQKYWNFLESRMINHRNKKSTTFEYSQYKYRTGLNESQFEKNALKRAR